MDRYGNEGEKMNHWLCVTNEENWNVVKENKIWGVSARHKNILNMTKIDDFLIFYDREEKIDNQIFPSRISGIFRAASMPFIDKKKIFSPVLTEDVFPYRVKIDPIIIKEIEFKPLIPKLTFIKNKKNWWGHIQGRAMRTIPESDFELIKNTMMKK